MDRQWVKGKSADTFAPLGPFLATLDEVDDVGNLELWLSVNGESRQKGSTRSMVFGVAEILSYLSQFMTLLPGDVVSTGTPPGVGLGFDPGMVSVEQVELAPGVVLVDGQELEGRLLEVDKAREIYQ